MRVGGSDSRPDQLTSRRRARQLLAAVCPRAARDWRLHQWTHGSSEKLKPHIRVGFVTNCVTLRPERSYNMNPKLSKTKFSFFQQFQVVQYLLLGLPLGDGSGRVAATHNGDRSILRGRHARLEHCVRAALECLPLEHTHRPACDRMCM